MAHHHHDGYPIPAGRHRIEIEVVNSRFIATVENAPDVETARTFIAAIRAEMPDANHHVYAYRVGFGGSVTDGMSDDGEPSGTAGPPVFAVVKGSGIGDIALVVTRYFGGTKLGTGGLVRAYGDAAREALKTLPTILKIEKVTLGLDLPYSLYQPIRRLVDAHKGEIVNETFEATVAVIARFPRREQAAFEQSVIELSSGSVTTLVLADYD